MPPKPEQVGNTLRGPIETMVLEMNKLVERRNLIGEGNFALGGFVIEEDCVHPLIAAVEDRDQFEVLMGSGLRERLELRIERKVGTISINWGGEAGKRTYRMFNFSPGNGNVLIMNQEGLIYEGRYRKKEETDGMAVLINGGAKGVVEWMVNGVKGEESEPPRVIQERLRQRIARGIAKAGGWKKL